MQRSSILTWLSIAVFAQLGALFRLTLAWLGGVDNHQRSSTLYSNFLGCIVIAAANTAKPRFDALGLTPIFNGISAGFCGALTTFSSWNMEIVRWLVSWPAPSVLGVGDHIYQFSAFSAILTELGVSCLGFQIGHLCSEALRETGPGTDAPAAAAAFRGASIESQYLMSPGAALYDSTIILPGKQAERRLVLHHRTSCGYMHGEEDAHEDAHEGLFLAEKSAFSSPLSAQLGCLAAAGCTVALFALMLPAAKSDGLTFILCFAPLGALLRYYLGLWCNSWLPHFKTGTFLANAVACLVLGLCTVFKAREQCFAPGTSDFEPWWNALLLGVSFGFCGALSTMSTLVAQLFEMDIVYGFAYFSVSLLTSQVLLATILKTFLLTSSATTVCA